jgi:proline iminopeptidase
MLPPQTLTIERNHARLRVRIWSRSGQAVILLHGGPGMPDYLMPVAGMLSHDLRVISYDQRGAGESVCSNSDYSYQAHVDDLASVARYFRLDRFHLFGHSWGGLLAQLYAGQYPETLQTLFLCNAMTGVGKGFLRMLAQLFKSYHKAAGPTGWVKMNLGALLLLIPGRMRNYGAQMLYKQIWRNFFAFSNIRPKINARWLQGVHGAAVLATLLSLVRGQASVLDPTPLSSQVPVLSLYGSHDVFSSEIDAVHLRYPWADRIVLPFCGHIPWFQNPIGFSCLLNDFYAPYRPGHRVPGRAGYGVE